MELSNRVVIVTGASAGIGREIAIRMAAENASLVLAARSRQPLVDLAEHLQHNVANCSRTLVVPTDVCKADDLQGLVDAALAEFGRIDVLVNNAGVECFDYFERLNAEQISATIQTNLTGALLLTHLTVPQMLKQGGGSIINMASTAGKHCPAFESVYGATKAALIAFTQGLRAEYEGRGIKVSSICPGFTRNGGIYERMLQDGGRKPPKALGSTSASKVARTVLKAIMYGGPEYIVNDPPVRPAIVLREIFPRLGEKLITAVTRRFVKQAVDARPSERKAA
ncbi:MAG: hypothetical protein Fues2KO_41930 [Fuerstiella sp.]